MPSLTLDQLRTLRLRAQHLLPHDSRTQSTVADTVHHLTAIQAQEAPSAALAVRARSASPTAADVTAAYLEDRTIVRAWFMRGTLHAVTTADLGWLLPMFGPAFIQKGQRRLRQLGIDAPTAETAMEAIRGLLSKHGPLTRAALAAYLSEQKIPTEGQAIYHLIARAAMNGILCYGPDQDGKPTFVLLSDWVSIRPSTLSDEESAGELARRYLAGHGPASPADFASWTGLGMRHARATFDHIASELIEIEVEGKLLWLLSDQRGWLEESLVLGLRLIPAYDPYLLGYQNRDWMVDPAYARRLHPGGGLLYPTVLLDGQAVATWKLAHTKTGLTLTVDPFTSFPASAHPLLTNEAADIGRFLDMNVALHIEST